MAGVSKGAAISLASGTLATGVFATAVTSYGFFKSKAKQCILQGAQALLIENASSCIKDKLCK